MGSGKYEAIANNNVHAIQGGAPFPGARLPGTRCVPYAMHWDTPLVASAVPTFRHLPAPLHYTPPSHPTDYLYECGSDHQDGEGGCPARVRP